MSPAVFYIGLTIGAWGFVCTLILALAIICHQEEQ